MSDLSKLPASTVGLRLCKARGDALILCEAVRLQSQAHVDMILRRAAISGSIGEVGETGDYWADLLDANGDMTETIALSREAWNGLKNHWLRCRIERSRAD